MKVILECSVNQKQMAPNNLLGNNWYQLNLLAHCITFIMWPSPISLGNGASEHRMLPTVLTGLRYWDKTGSRLGNDPVSLSGRLTHRTPSLLSPACRVMLPIKLSFPALVELIRQQRVSRSEEPAATVTTRQGTVGALGAELGAPHWPRQKGPLALLWSGSGEKGVLGWGVFIYNLGFVCTVYCILLWHVLVLLCFWVFLHNMQRHWSGHIIFTCQECRQCFSTKV